MFSISKDAVGRTFLRVNPATPQDVLATLRMASVDFAHLVHRGESMDARRFSQRICDTYGASPRRDAVVRALASQPAPGELPVPEDDEVSLAARIGLVERMGGAA